MGLNELIKQLTWVNFIGFDVVWNRQLELAGNPDVIGTKLINTSRNLYFLSKKTTYILMFF